MESPRDLPAALMNRRIVTARTLAVLLLAGCSSGTPGESAGGGGSSGSGGAPGPTQQPGNAGGTSSSGGTTGAATADGGTTPGAGAGGHTAASSGGMRTGAGGTTSSGGTTGAATADGGTTPGGAGAGGHTAASSGGTRTGAGGTTSSGGTTPGGADAGGHTAAGSGGTGAGAGGLGAGTAGGSASGGTAGGSASGGTAGGSASGGTGPSAGCGDAVPQGTTFSLSIQDKDRSYIVRVPSGYDVNTPYPLVLAFHGLGGTMQGIDGGGYFGMQQVAGDRAILIAPNGYESSDDYDTFVSGNGFWDENGQDIEFVAAIVDWAKESLCVDADRVFAIGHSFGGMMSDNIGCKLTSTFRAVAPASSSFRRVYVDLETDCTQQPIAAMLTHGTNDNFVPFVEGQEARDYFLSVNGCTSNATPTTPSGCVNYEGCGDGHPVKWCEHQLAHGVWDNAGTGTSLGATAWEFFSQF